MHMQLRLADAHKTHTTCTCMAMLQDCRRSRVVHRHKGVPQLCKAYLHSKEAKALPVQQQAEHNEGQGDVCAQDAQRRNANKIAEEGLLAH